MAIAQQMFAFQFDIRVRRIINTVFIRINIAKASKKPSFLKYTNAGRY